MNTMAQPTTPRIAVVILNYNTADCLQRFLPLVIQTNYNNMEIIVADNASSDHSVALMQREFPDIRLLVFSENSGYTGGYNKALQQIEADYYVLLNSDVETPPDWLTPMVSMAVDNPCIGAIQPIILDYNKRDHYEYAGAAGGFIDSYGYVFCRGRLFDNIEKRRDDYEKNGPIFWASGACLMVRSDVFHLIGGLDDRFFAHMEEIDLCWRIHRAGYSVQLCSTSHVFHVGGATLPTGHPRKVFLNFHNNLVLLYKNTGGLYRIKTLLIRLILDHIAAYRFLFQGKWSFFRSVGKAHFAFLTSLSDLKKRYPPVSVVLPESVYRGSIISEYYLRKKRYFSSLSPSGWRKRPKQ
jgi:GT2 family glycosyltransferase